MSLRGAFITFSTLESMLHCIDPSCSRNEWFAILASAKSEFGEDAREIMKEWSAASPSFDSKSFNSTWKSIKLSGGITIGTIIHLAKQGGYTLNMQTENQSDWQLIEYQRKHRKAKQAASQIREKKRIDKGYGYKSEQANKILANHQPAPNNHPYLLRKNIKSHGILLGSVLGFKDALIIPVYGSQPPFVGIIQSIQFILTNGEKKLLPGGKKSGGYYPIQWVENAPIVICEGFATGATLAEHYTQESCVICAFDAGNLAKVAKAFRLQYPLADIVIAGDNDRFNKDGSQSLKNTGIEAATIAAKAIKGALMVPEFMDSELGSDWNDRYMLDHKKIGGDA